MTATPPPADNGSENKGPQSKGPQSAGRSLLSVLPGTFLCAVIAAVAISVQFVEELAFAHPYVEALVLAILIGIVVRSFWRPGSRWTPGIHFSAKLLLEIAVMLLGASISFSAIVASGPALLGGIVATVTVAIFASYAISRVLGLSRHVSILVACGNSICGNSAIAAVAPVIGATSADIATSIAFTAVLGVVVVLGLPLAFPLLHLNETQYGALAGLTVYAVPQVLAATIPIGLVATQIGTLVKLVRVLMLGPVVIVLSLLRSRISDDKGKLPSKPSPFQLVPWFILGFLVLAGVRSLGFVPDRALKPLTFTAGILTIVSMAALGLGVDIRVIGRLGGRVTFAVTGSLVVLFAISLGLVRLLGIH